MPDLGNPDLPPFLRLARLLDSGLFASEPSSDFKALVPRDDAQWEGLFGAAWNNKSVAPLSYIFSAKPAFGVLAGEVERTAMRDWNAAFAMRSGEIRNQIIELAELFAENDQRLMLLKGGAHLFDGLYPDISCRYSVDIDPLIEDPKIFYKVLALGYEPYDDPSLDMKPILEGDISGATGIAFHHLPPLYREGDQASVELHTRPFLSRFDDLAIPDLWQAARPISHLPNVVIPSLTHQIIINIVHTLLTRDQFDLSVRDLYEGHLLYRKASDRERSSVRSHFDAAGHSGDFELWNSVCFRTFRDPIHDIGETRSHRKFFARLTKTQANSKVWLGFWFISKIKRLVVLELWNPERRRVRMRRFLSGKFWRQVATVVGSALNPRK